MGYQRVACASELLCARRHGVFHVQDQACIEQNEWHASSVDVASASIPGATEMLMAGDVQGVFNRWSIRAKQQGVFERIAVASRTLGFLNGLPFELSLN